MKLNGSKLKLKTKTLFIPVTILLISFVIIGVVFTKLIISNSNNLETRRRERWGFTNAW